MTTEDIMTARGQVLPSFLDITSGKRFAWDMRHNTISYAASMSMASAFGGDSTYIPNRIGIIYGSEDDPQFGDISRMQSWESLHDELELKKADIQVQAFCFTPTLKEVSKEIASDESSTSIITGTAVTFHSHSDSDTAGEFGTAYNKEGTQKGQKFQSETRIYQAVLLNKTSDKYRVIARASLLNNGEYNKKPANFEVAIDWTIKFF